MRKWIRKSFKRRQLLGFLLVALMPMLISSLSMTRLVQVKVESDYEKRVEQQTEEVDVALNQLFSLLEDTVKNIEENKKIITTIEETDSWIRNKTYTQFYSETTLAREYAQFDIYNREGSCIFSTGNSYDQTLPIYWGILNAAFQKQGELVFMRTDTLEKDETIMLRGAKTIYDEQNRFIGYVVISMRGENFEKALQGTFNSQKGIAILDSYWETIYSEGAAREKEIGTFLRNKLMNGEYLPTVYNGNHISITPIGETGLMKVIMNQEVFSNDITRAMYTVIIFTALASFVLCVMVAQRISNSLFFPIKRMNDAMHHLQNGQLDTRIPVDRQDELGQMSENFNIMANKLEHYMEEQIRAQKELNASSIAMMQAQLNPHFLYNTLDNMKWIAKANQVSEIAIMSAGLAKILRTSISNQQFITILEEIELVSSYIEIQKIRFNDRFQFVVDLPELLKDCIVPKLIIQPIVENAILHGLEECENGKIWLKVYQVENSLCIDVKDNGCGIDDEIMQVLNSRDREKLCGHIGFFNVDTIIRLQYGEEYGLHVKKTEEGGTLVIIMLPVEK